LVLPASENQGYGYHHLCERSILLMKEVVALRVGGERNGSEVYELAGDRKRLTEAEVMAIFAGGGG